MSKTRGNGSGRSGSTKKKNNNSNSNTRRTTTVEYKYAPNSSGRQQYASSKLIREKLKHECAEYEYPQDIQYEITELKTIQLDEPELKYSEEKDAEKKELQNNAFAKNYDSEMKEWRARVRKIGFNRTRMVTLIQTKYCTLGMVDKLKSEEDFESKLDKDPVALLLRLEKLSHDPTGATYAFATLTKAIFNLVAIKQEEHESADTFGYRVQDTFNTLAKYLGPHWLNQFMDTLPGFDPEKNWTSEQKTAWRQQGPTILQAYIMVNNAFHPKYKDLKTNLRERYTRGQDEYPRDLAKAVNIVHTAKFASDYKANRQSGGGRSDGSPPKNNASNQGGSSGGSSFAQQAPKKPVFCYCCGAPDHKVPDCPKKNQIARDDWASNKFNSYMQEKHAAPPQQQAATPVTQSAPMRRSEQTSSQSSQQTSWSQPGTSFQGMQTITISPEEYEAFMMFKYNEQQKFHGCQIADKLSGSDEYFGYHLSQELVEEDRIRFDAGSQPDSVKQDCGAMFSQLPEGTMLAVDCGSTFAATVQDGRMCHNIRELDTPIGMKTNVGIGKFSIVGDIPGLPGTAVIHKSFLMNCVGWTHLSDTFPMWYDNRKADIVYVETPWKIVEFTRRKNGMYMYQVSKEFLDAVAAMRKQEGMKEDDPLLQLAQVKSKTAPAETAGVGKSVPTVDENLKMIPQRERAGMEKARQLYFRMGTPTIRTLREAIKHNVIRNCPVTEKDVRNMVLVYGEDVGALKGRVTRQRPAPVKVDWAEIPRSLVAMHKELEYCMDLMFVNKEVFLTGIDLSVRYRHCIHIENRSKKSVLAGFNEILRSYNAAGFRISVVSCDGEFEKILDPVKGKMQITTNYASADEHVHAAERNNRIIKERVRICYARLPFNRMPRVMLRNMVTEGAHSVTIVPTKLGISDQLSPYTIITGRHIDYDKELQFGFGSYVNVNQDGDNTMNPRTIDAIYLRPARNFQGGHVVMDLRSGREISRPRAWLVPMTQRVIDRVHEMADQQKIGSLSIKHRSDSKFNASRWLAGVDGENDDDDEDWNESDNDSDSDSESSYESDEDEDEWEELDQNELADLLASGSRPVPVVDNQDQPPALLPRANQAYDDDSDSSDDEESDDGEEAKQDDSDDDSDDDSSDDGIPEGIREAVREQTQRIDDTMEEIRASGRPKRKTRIPDRLNLQQQHVKPTKTMFGYHLTMADIKKGLSPEEKDAIIEDCHNITEQQCPRKGSVREYDEIEGMVMAQYINELNDRFQQGKYGHSYGQQYLLDKGLKVFGERGYKAAMKEIGQLHDRVAFAPRDPATMTEEQRRKTQVALMFCTEKRDESVKGRMVFNGKPTRKYLGKDDSKSPTVSLEGLMLTAVVNAHEGRDVMTADVPNAFVQTEMPVDSEPVFMKIQGALVDMLVSIAPDVYKPFVMFERGQKVLYTQVMKAIYGMLVAALLWYRKFRKDLESIGFVFNPYDPCICNRMINGKQHTLGFHVDDLMSGHVDAKVNDAFLEWLNEMYGSLGAVKATRGHIHDYLGMTLDFSQPGKLIVDMTDYVGKMVDDFSIKFDPDVTVSSPAAETLFHASTGEKLDQKRAEEYHTFTAKGLFVCKRARPDIHPTIAVLCTRVQSPTESDWEALLRMLHYCDSTWNDKLILSADNLNVIKWYVDAAFAVHPDFRSHTGAVATLGQGGIITMSKKQKLNTRSSTEAELVGADDTVQQLLWTRLFMESQGYRMDTVLKQDNKSTIQLENNGKDSSTSRTRALNIRYFFLTDQIQQGNLVVEYCPTDKMIGDFMSKPLQGAAFKKFRDQIMGYAPPSDF